MSQPSRTNTNTGSANQERPPPSYKKTLNADSEVYTQNPDYEHQYVQQEPYVDFKSGDGRIQRLNRETGEVTEHTSVTIKAKSAAKSAFEKLKGFGSK